MFVNSFSYFANEEHTGVFGVCKGVQLRIKLSFRGAFGCIGWLLLPEGSKIDIKTVADRQGLSANGCIGKLIDKAMERERAPGGGFRFVCGVKGNIRV